MKHRIQSASPKAISFAMMNAMSNELSPSIQRLKEWRALNHLTQADAVEVFEANGLPVPLEKSRPLPRAD
jgi:hypothetical protein